MEPMSASHLSYFFLFLRHTGFPLMAKAVRLARALAIQTHTSHNSSIRSDEGLTL